MDKARSLIVYLGLNQLLKISSISGTNQMDPIVKTILHRTEISN